VGRGVRSPGGWVRCDLEIEGTLFLLYGHLVGDSLPQKGVQACLRRVGSTSKHLVTSIK